MESIVWGTPVLSGNCSINFGIQCSVFSQKTFLSENLYGQPKPKVIYYIVNIIVGILFISRYEKEAEDRKGEKMGTGYCYGCMEQIAAYPCPKCGYTPMRSNSPYALQPGTILHKKYLVGKLLGQGGFGITYVGMDLQLRRKVAIKEFYPAGFVSRKTGTGNVVWYASEAAQDARVSGQEMFLKEARKMSKVSDIGPVVRVFDVFQENETAYICMDFIEGITLLEYLKKTGPLSWNQAKALFLPVIQTMDHMHKIGLIHRDLSPDNLMIQPNGDVKILDLGAAKDLNLNSGKSSMQVAKNGFSPLEQYIQSGNSGSWTDVYALAATMYHALTGILPPSAIDRMDQDTIRWDLPQLQALPSGVCGALMRAMTIRSGERTQTMEAFLRELQGHTPSVRKPKKRLITVAAAVAVTLAVAGAAIGIISGEKAPAASGAGSQSGSLAVTSITDCQNRIDALMASCTMEVFDYRNGAKMELYFDDQDNECLRIFINDEGREQFLFLAEYDSEGRILEEFGFDNQVLVRHTTWTRNADGNITEILEYGENGVLLEKSQVTYDSQGREVSRTRVDGEGRTLLQAQSSYDSRGRETYSGTNEDGSKFVQTYTEDGKIEESINTDQNGAFLSRTVYKYNSSGNQTEYLSYDENDQLSYRSQYHYIGNLQVGFTSHSYYNGNEHISEYDYIFGPRDIQFGQINKDAEYGSETEYVQDMRRSWNLRHFSYDSGSSRIVYRESYFNWDWETLGSAEFDEEGNLVGSSETLFDESGRKTGSKSLWYNVDGSYSVSLYDEKYTALSREEFGADGRLESKTEYLYDASGKANGDITITYNDDGSYTESESDTSYNIIVTRTYDSAGTLVGSVEYSYDSSGSRTGSTLTTYYYDGSYTITVKDGNSRTVSEKTYDASGNLIKSS